VSLLTAFAAAFFFCSWLLGQVIRIDRQQTTEDSLAELKGNMTEQARLTTILVERTKDIPALLPLVQDLSRVTTTANTQVEQISTAVSTTPPMGWVTDWALPQRLIPNPEIYAPLASTPPLPLTSASATDEKKEGITQRSDRPA
jgi:hypothetical protein